MTPQLARIALCGFLCLAAGVAYNALYAQQPMRGRVSTIDPPAKATDRKTPERSSWSPSKPTTKAEERKQGTFQANSIKLENPPEPGAVDGRPDTIRAVQRELKSRGYGPLSIDGTPGLATRAAIMAFEADEGLALTAVANEMLLKEILLGSSQPRSAGTEPGPRAQEVIRATQNWLGTLGFPVGSASGLLDQKTVAAIRAFEVSQGLSPRGRISADLVTRLANAVPLKAEER